MADQERLFNIEVNAGGHAMSSTTKATSPGELVEHATERFGIRMSEIRKLTIESSTIKIKITASETATGERQ